uniref:Bcl-2-like protein 13 n=1 Tax=Esox lucius TaxID=8010 RepID=A0AAY5JWN7_ESOLU
MGSFRSKCLGNVLCCSFLLSMCETFPNCGIALPGIFNILSPLYSPSQPRVTSREILEKYPVFTLEGKVPAVSRGDDSGEVSSLSGEQRSDWLGPSALRLVQGDSSGPVSWQTESSLAESWSTVGDMDPEDSRSLDNLTEERSEDHYSISDMLHLEQDAEEEDEEMLSEEEDGSLAEVEEELQASVMSVLGGERELAELREEELAGQAVLPSSEVSALPTLKADAEPATSTSDSELPVLLCAGAALVAVVGIVAYGAMAYCRK